MKYHSFVHYTILFAVLVLMLSVSSAASAQSSLVGNHTGWSEKDSGMESVKIYTHTKSGAFIILRGNNSAPIVYEGSDTQSAYETNMGVKPMKGPLGYPFTTTVNIGGKSYKAKLYQNSAKMHGNLINFFVYDIDDGNGNYYEVVKCNRPLDAKMVDAFMAKSLKLEPIARMSLQKAIETVNGIDKVLKNDKIRQYSHIDETTVFVSVRADSQRRVYSCTYRFTDMVSSDFTPAVRKELTDSFKENILNEIKTVPVCATFFENGYTFEIIIQDRTGMPCLKITHEP